MTVPRISLCKDGPKFSQLVQGFWRLSDWNYSASQTIQLIEDCLSLGLTTFDHADIYGEYACEELFGNAWKEMSVPRESVEIVTKCGIKLDSEKRPSHRIKSYDTSKQHILQSVNHSLKALQTEYIDLLLIHRPDPLMDADEVAEAFVELRAAGKVRYFGVSNFTPGQFHLLASRLDFPLVTNQIEYSVLSTETQEDGSIDLCQQLGIRPMAWSPFGGGRLFSGQSEQAIRVRKALSDLGAELNETELDRLALAWILAHPVQFLPVLGTGKIERIQSAVKSLELKLTREQWYSVWQASKGHPVP
ncbi:MAG: aldo/keto reductase [Candidatus Hinthialibacter antarcticus]|nr:aldo/keto reductase [Candidatus Hinthialibacter antarcticus]